MKKISKLAALSLLTLSTVNSLHAYSDYEKEGKTSWNFRDYTESDSIPLMLMSTVVSRLSQVNIGVITKEMENNGETQRVVMSKVSLEGGLVQLGHNFDFDSFENLKDFRVMWIPFKITLEEDGSYSRSVGLFSIQNNEDFDMDSFSGWVKVRDLKLAYHTSSKDEFTGNQQDKFDIVNIKVDIGLLDFDNSAVYLKTGFSAGGYENTYMTQSGDSLVMDAKPYEYQAGLHYRAGSMSNWFMDVGVGYQSEVGEGKNVLNRDREMYNSQMGEYNTAHDMFQEDLENYMSEKENFEIEHGFPVGSVSEESFANHPDGRVKPNFTMREPKLDNTRTVLNRKSVYGSVKVLKYLEDQNIQVGFSLKARSFQDNNATGVNSLQEDILLQLRDKNRVDASFEVRF